MLFLRATTALAADGPVLAPPHYITPCTLYQVSGTGEICGWKDVDDYKLVLAVDDRAWFLGEELKEERAKSADLVLEVANLKDQVGLLEKSQDLLDQRNKELTKQLLDVDQKYQNEAAKSRLGNPIAWIVAGTSLSVLAGVLLSKL
jgi:hypothetical protein